MIQHPNLLPGHLPLILALAALSWGVLLLLVGLALFVAPYLVLVGRVLR